MDFRVFINGLSLSFACIGVLLSLFFLLLIYSRIRPLKSNIPLILTCNTYLISLISSLIICKQSSQTIHGILYSAVSYETFSCQINGYFIYVALGNVFYSFILQAIFRLVRIVFSRKKSLHSLRVFSIGILLQWITVLLINLSFVLFNDMEYISSEYRCQVSLTNVRGCLMVLIIEYMIPMNIMLTIYFYIIRYIRRINNRMLNRVHTHRHDMFVFKQLLILFVIIEMLSMPLCVLWLMYVVQKYLTPLSYQLQSLTVAFSQAFIPIILAYTTPQIRKKFIRGHRVHPIIKDRLHQNRHTAAIREQRF